MTKNKRIELLETQLEFLLEHQSKLVDRVTRLEKQRRTLEEYLGIEFVEGHCETQTIPPRYESKQPSGSSSDSLKVNMSWEGSKKKSRKKPQHKKVCHECGKVCKGNIGLGIHMSSAHKQ